MHLKFYILLLASCIHSTYSADGWTQIAGWAKQISAKGDELWCVNNFGVAFRWEHEKWAPKGSGLLWIAACPHGCAWGRSRQDRGDGNALLYTGATEKFSPIKVFSGWLDNLNAIGAERAVGVNSNGVLWHFKVADNWKPIQPQTVLGTQLAIGDNDEIWMVDGNSKIYRYNGATWDEQPGTAVYIDVQSKNRVVITDHYYNAYILNGTSGWTQLPGAECVQATINNEYVYCVSSSGGIYSIKA